MTQFMNHLRTRVLLAWTMLTHLPKKPWFLLHLLVSRSRYVRQVRLLAYNELEWLSDKYYDRDGTQYRHPSELRPSEAEMLRGWAFHEFVAGLEQLTTLPYWIAMSPTKRYGYAALKWFVLVYLLACGVLLSGVLYYQ